MNKFAGILLLLINLTFITANCQVVYDTIPSDFIEYWVGGHYFEYTFVFENIEKNFPKNINIPEVPVHYPHQGTVIVGARFGKSGEIENTKVLRSINPIFDSVAFSVIENLNGWIPGMNRGRFIGIDVTIPFAFRNDSLVNLDNLIGRFQYNSDAEEFNRRLEYFNFIYSEDPNLPITSSRELFSDFLTEHFSQQEYTHRMNYILPKYKDRVRITTNLKRIGTEIYLRELGKDHILFTVRNPRKLLLDKTKKYVAISYILSENGEAIVAIEEIDPLLSELVVFEFQFKNKSQFLDSLKEYAP